MRQSRTRISQVIAYKVLKNGLSEKLAREIAAYLLSERRVNQLNSVIRDVQADWAEAGHVEVIAASAHPLSEEVRAEIKQQVGKQYPNAEQIMIIEKFDPAVIGGVRLELPNQELDLSVEAKLSKFKQLSGKGLNG